MSLPDISICFLLDPRCELAGKMSMEYFAMRFSHPRICPYSSNLMTHWPVRAERHGGRFHGAHQGTKSQKKVERKRPALPKNKNICSLDPPFSSCRSPAGSRREREEEEEVEGLSLQKVRGRPEAMGALGFPGKGTLKAVLFDVDGTLCDSDPLHYLAFRDMLQEVGFQDGVPITEEFFIKNISGGENRDLGIRLFPDWPQDRRDKFLHDKEELFCRLAAEQLKPVNGLDALCKWVEKEGLQRAAVTNAPRKNAELMVSLLGLSSFFEIVIIGGECERSKPFPDPYQNALKHFGLSPHEAFVLEDSATGLRAAVAAGITAVGVATRNPEESLRAAGAAFVIKDYEDSKLWEALGSSSGTTTT